MTDPAPTPPRRPRILAPGAALTVVVLLCAAWAESARYVVTDPADYRYFPPFTAGVDRLLTHHLGAEYLCIAKAVRAGRGFADPFREESGPTAWMPPALPYLTAVVLWLTDDDLVAAKYVVLGLQTLTLVLTGWLLVAASARAVGRPWLGAAFGAAFGAQEFYHCFQVTHDPWLILLCLNALLIGYAVLPGSPGRVAAVAWGAVGGAIALAGPVLGLVWTALTALRWPGRWRAWLGGVAAAGLVMLPWAVRNYVTFGRLVPVKANLFYELYQATCRTRDNDGLVGANSGFDTHPWSHPGEERDRYVDDGEAAFLDQKKALFLAAFRKDPERFVVHVWNRAAAATVMYVPYTRQEQEAPPSWYARYSDLVHPLPFLAAVVLLLAPRPLHRYEAAALCVYAAWLLPYIAVSYYVRYGFPLLAVKAFLCTAAADRLWAGVRWAMARRRQRQSAATRNTVNSEPSPTGRKQPGDSARH